MLRGGYALCLRIMTIRTQLRCSHEVEFCNRCVSMSNSIGKVAHEYQIKAIHVPFVTLINDSTDRMGRSCDKKHENPIVLGV